MSGNVQLGLLRLELAAGPSAPETAWTDLTIDRIKLCDISPTCRKLHAAILYLLGDAGVNLQGACRTDENGCAIRVSLTPSDSQGSTWNRTSDGRGKRQNSLSTIFQNLQEGWELEEGRYLLDRLPQDKQKMSDLYTAIPSPTMPKFTIAAGQTAPEQEVYYRLTNFEEPAGIQTTLYRYQFRSVARMLQMETEPGKLVDPGFVPFRESGRDGTYYVNLSSFDIQRLPGWYSLPRGGILCEQMGVGKTLMCITLIMATLSTPPAAPRDTMDSSPAMSSQSLSIFPFDPHIRARDALGIRQPSYRVPTLVELCGEVLNNRDSSAKHSALLSPPAEAILSRSMFYLTYPSEHSCYRGPRQAYQKEDVHRTWLAKSTLVVVPQILIAQWKLEVTKHVVDGGLKVLEIDKELPTVEEMMTFDMILLSVERFGLEDASYRAKHDQPPSEFAKARWKRIILDEGHVASNKMSNAMRLARELSIERRWIVSGTPTKHLQQGGEIEMEGFARKLQDPTPQKVLRWSRWDLDDATRIGNMVGGFLAAEPFRSGSNFQDQVTKYLRRGDGPSFGAVGRLRYIMSALMVKHAPKVIDEEASLPPSTISVEILPFHPMQRITYNVLTSLIASNVYTSNFEDPDYFLHPRNAQSFNTVVQNLHLACFWYSAYEMGAAECLDRTKKQLESNEQLTPSGRAALEDAVAHLETALATPGWEEWMANGVSLPFEAGSLPETIKDAWSDSMYTLPDLIDAKSLHTLRELNTPGRSLHDLHLLGWESRTEKHAEMFQELEKAASRTGKGVQPKSKVDKTQDKKKVDVQAAAHMPTASETFAKSPTKAKRKTTLADPLRQHLEQATRNATLASRPIVLPSGPLPLPSTIKTKSRSAKLNFVLDSVLSSARGDKFVIFGDKYELGHVSEALDLVDIKSCFAGTTVGTAQRAQALQDFEAPDTKVCLLDLRLGARGLNLVVANRMIFISPVWNLDVQAQAIKRVHRIGQTKPTKVEILVTRGTFEEGIAERSSAARTEKDEQLYSRALIENPRFVHSSEETDTEFTIRFAEKDDQSSPARSSSSGSRAITPMPITPTLSKKYEVDEDMIIVASRDDLGPSPSRARFVNIQPQATPTKGTSKRPAVKSEGEDEALHTESTPKRRKGRVTFA